MNRVRSQICKSHRRRGMLANGADGEQSVRQYCLSTLTKIHCLCFAGKSPRRVSLRVFFSGPLDPIEKATHQSRQLLSSKLALEQRSVRDETFSSFS